MGRLSKFSFPIPGWKSRPAAEPQEPEVYAPKVQRLLGNTPINVDSQWDGKSASGMSIAVSESTAHHPTDRAPGSRSGAARARSQWGDDSDIVPPPLRRAAPAPTGYNPRTESHYDPSDDISSLRKRQSSSTILSYYDKSRVPLSVSQQTSASAMAKGLSTKATSLLDIDGTMSPPVRKLKPKPAKRDISNIFSRPRTGGSNKSAPGREYTADPPPALPLTHKFSQATLTSFKAERDVPRKTTRERLHEFTGRGPPKNPPPEVPVQRMTRKVSEATDLNHLYDHYEQMSFRQVMGDEEIPPGIAAESGQEPPAHESGIPGLPQSDQYNPDKPVAPGPGPPDIEYATSISSRHTRTSKASKKTTPSFIESDLQLQSVLSLSSDSEDDGYVQQPKPSPRPVRSRNGVADEESRPLSERRRSTASKSSANSGKSGKSGIRASLASRNAYLTIPTEPLPPCPPEVARRTSSLAHRSSDATAPPPRPSRVNVISPSTAGFASRHLQDARMAPMNPGQHLQSGGDSRRSGTPVPPRRASLRSVEEQTRPLSPKSADQRRQAELQDPLNPRFMAVSRQEEMLLSALRMKRARMRGNPLGELEEEDYIEDLPEASPVNNNPQDSGAYAAPVRAIQKKESKSSISTARDESRHSPHTAPRPAAGAGTQKVTRPASVAPAESAASKRQLSLQLQQHKGRRDAAEASMLCLDEDETGEPSPDLSDFMDLDNGSEETDGQSSRGREGKGTGDKTPVTPSDPAPSPALGPQKKLGFEGLRVVTEETAPGVPRPDSPISPQLPLFPAPGGTRKGIRLSAVGGVAGMEASWWGDDG